MVTLNNALDQRTVGLTDRLELVFGSSIARQFDSPMEPIAT